MAELRHANHKDVPPLADGNSRVLVLGSMLSPKSAQERFYYAHPQNRFWRVLAEIFGAKTPQNNDERRRLALENGIALWDVIKSCDIIGASDNTITDVEYNDIAAFLAEHSGITRIFTTGGKAHELLKKYNADKHDPIIAAAVRLPSTSPLNCAARLDDLIDAYTVLKTVQ